MTTFSILASPLGDLVATGDAAGLTGLALPTGRHPVTPGPDWVRDDTAFEELRRQLAEYFAGTRREFTVALHPRGSTFQRIVWDALLEIGYGQTTSYGALAARIGLPTAARAVGLANGQNPIPIIVPCHRVIGANGALTGYGGGLPAKRWLLAHESGQAGLFAS